MSFTGIDKQEFKPLVEYLKTKKGIKARNADEDGKVIQNEDYPEVELQISEGSFCFGLRTGEFGDGHLKMRDNMFKELNPPGRNSHWA